MVIWTKLLISVENLVDVPRRVHHRERHETPVREPKQQNAYDVEPVLREEDRQCTLFWQVVAHEQEKHERQNRANNDQNPTFNKENCEL